MKVRGDGGDNGPNNFLTDCEKALPEHYRLIRSIGRGGMAEVYLAKDTRLNRLVAIKFLNSELQKHPDRMRRFKQEARTASALNHPNILTIHDIGDNEGVQFIISEYVNGETLASRISRGKIPIPEAIDIVLQIGSALKESHNAGIVHRDLKPENVMIRHDGSAKVLDFGLAKDTGNNFEETVEFDANELTRVSTSPGLILGTPRYMSPEQARGGQLDGRTDIFSLGIILFEAVTGHRPFDGGSLADVIAAIIGKEPPSLEQYVDNPPIELARVIEKALQKDPDERYQSMEPLLLDLKDVKQELVANSYSGAGTVTTKVISPTPATVAVQRNVRLKWVIAASAASIFALGAWWLIERTNDATPGMKVSMTSVSITSWNATAGESIFAGSFSPDGKMVAFSSSKTGSTEIWVKPTVGGDPIQVTKNGFYNQYPVWSQNGQELAFFSRRSGSNGIWRVSFTGGNELQMVSGVAPTARPIQWYDGKIYYQEGLDIFVADDSAGKREQLTDFESQGVRPFSIAISPDASAFAISVRDGDVWKIKKKQFIADQFVDVASSKEQIENISFDHNGRSIVYSAAVEGTLQIFRVDWPGATSAQISNGSADQFLLDVSADGSRVLFGSVSESSDLWVLNTENQSESPVVNDVPLEYWPDLSPDGKSVVFQSVAQPDRPFRGSILVSQLLSRASSPTIVSTDGISPVWSHDGQFIAFFRRSASRFAIWKSRATGAEAMKIADGLGVPFSYLSTPYLKKGIGHISWSPDDKSIAYSCISDRISNICVASSDGSPENPLTSNSDPKESFRYPVWTADGKLVVCASESGPPPGGSPSYKLWQLSAARSEQRIVYESAQPFVFLGIAPTGDQAFIAEKADADLSPTPDITRLFVVSLTTKAKKLIATLDKAYISNIQLSRDGQSIAFVTRQANISEIWVTSTHGDRPKKLLAENDPKTLISSLSWGQDHKTIIFGKQTRTNLISMLAN